MSRTNRSRQEKLEALMRSNEELRKNNVQLLAELEGITEKIQEQCEYQKKESEKDILPYSNR